MDASRIAKQLKLKQRGLADGAKNIPPIEMAEQDEISCSIDAVLAKMLGTERMLVRDSVRELKAWIGGIITRLNNTHANLRRIESSATNRFYEIITEGCNRLWNLHREYLNAHQSLQHFRETHGLKRVPQYPQSAPWNWGILMLIFSIEVAVNGFTLQDVHPEGFIGIITAMFMISFINITGGLGAGFVYRYINHYQWHNRLFGRFSALMLILALLLFNCLVGHWRNVLASMDVDINILSFNALLGVRLLDNFLDNPFLFSDFKSYLMAIVGFIFCGIAAWKGYNWEDPYPGYARTNTIMDNYRSDYRYQLSAIRATLRNAKDDILQSIALLGNSYGGDCQLILDYRQELKDLKERYQEFTALTKKTGDFLYTTYRYVNVKKRTEPTPPCFAIPYMVPADLSSTEDIEQEAMNAVWQSDTDIYKLSQNLEHHISHLYQEYLTVCGMIDSVEIVDATLRKTVEETIHTIQKTPAILKHE